MNKIKAKSNTDASQGKTVSGLPTNGQNNPSKNINGPDAALILACEKYCSAEAMFRSFFDDGETPIEDDDERMEAQEPYREAQKLLLKDIIFLKATTLAGAVARAKAADAWTDNEGDYAGEDGLILFALIRDLTGAEKKVHEKLSYDPKEPIFECLFQRR